MYYLLANFFLCKTVCIILCKDIFNQIEVVGVFVSNLVSLLKFYQLHARDAAGINAGIYGITGDEALGLSVCNCLVGVKPPPPTPDLELS